MLQVLKELVAMSALLDGAGLGLRLQINPTARKGRFSSETVVMIHGLPDARRPNRPGRRWSNLRIAEQDDPAGRGLSGRGAHPARSRHRDPLRNGETFLPGVVATDLDTEHGGTNAN